MKPLTQDEVNTLRGDFPILSKPLTFGGKSRTLVYLDNSATTHKPRPVIDAVSSYYETANSNVHRGIHSLGEESTRIFEEARETVREFIGARSLSEIIFTRGTTEAINLVARSFCELLSPGDEIITTEMEHHANLVPWQMAAQRHGLILKFISFNELGELNLEDLETLWSDRVKLVAVTHCSNVLGTINPVKEIIQWVHSRGAAVLVDGAQSVPHLKVDVQDLDPDFLVFSGHKMCGPTGTGILYGKEKWLEKMPPFHGGGEMIRSVSLEGFTLNELPYKFEAGTPDMSGAAGLAAAMKYLSNIGLDRIHAYETQLLNRAMKQLDNIDGLQIYGRSPGKGGIISFTLEDTHAHDLSAYLDKYGIAVRAGHHCAHPLAKKLGVVSTARASFYFYNTLDEIDFFCQVLSEARKVL